MELTDIFNGAEAAAFILAAVLAVFELRRHHRRVRSEATLELVHSFQTPEFARGLDMLFSLPDDLSKKEIEQRLGEDSKELMIVFTTIESLGALVFRDEVDLQLVDDFFSGPILLCWSKCGKYIQELRDETDRQTIGEWIQWLAERLGERENVAQAIPAHIEHRNWKPTR